MAKLPIGEGSLIMKSLENKTINEVLNEHCEKLSNYLTIYEASRDNFNASVKVEFLDGELIISNFSEFYVRVKP